MDSTHDIIKENNVVISKTWRHNVWCVITRFQKHFLEKLADSLLIAIKKLAELAEK